MSRRASTREESIIGWMLVGEAVIFGPTIAYWLYLGCPTLAH